MSLANTIAQAHTVRAQALNRQSGKWLLAQTNPNEFDYYMMGIELLNSDLTTQAYFMFPIMPSSISYDDTPLTKVTQTAAGVSVLKQSQFNVKKLMLTGSFGREFKILMGTESLDLSHALVNKSILSTSTLHTFSQTVKTGYGCTKYLEALLNQSKQLDYRGKPHHLIIYNLAFNQKFLVELETQTYSQTEDKNMMWQYSLTFKAIGNAEEYLGSKVRSTAQLINQDLGAKAMNAAYKKVTKALTSSYNAIKSSLF